MVYQLSDHETSNLTMRQTVHAFGSACVMIMVWATFCAWIAYLFSDAEMNRLTANIVALGASLETIEESVDARLKALEEHVNNSLNAQNKTLSDVDVRVTNLHTRLDTLADTQVGAQ